MSAVTAPRRTRLEPRRARAYATLAPPPARPGVRVLTFAALGLYGSLRWATLVAPAATGRMLLLLGFAVAAGGVLSKRAQLGGRSRLLAVAGVLALIVVSLPVCGVPLTYVVHLHIRAIVDGVGLGLTALPRVIVPYAGLNGWARTVILLGGGLLLLDAGVLLAFVPHSLGDARRAGAALPLIALAVVPSALEAADAEYLQGLLLFVLVAAFVWGERLGRRELLPALAVAGLAGVGGVLAAPRLDIHHPLLNYQSIANTLGPSGVETFQWYQAYGPYNWPTDGQEVLSIGAAHSELWKTENLDDFDGRGWVEAQPSLSSLGPGPPAAPAPSLLATATWTQTLHIIIGNMYTNEVVASGTAQTPTDVPGGVSPGLSPGTWTANRQLGPGDAYAVKVYSPNPAPGQLETAGMAYPAVLAYYRQIFLPALGAHSTSGTIVFPEFGSLASAGSGARYVASTMATTPYAAAYRLAKRLAAGTTTPYGFVARVQSYLRRNYTYNTQAPISADPIETFLFKQKYGYCQQFAGAMALLLRMGGIPARVAVGFEPGSFAPATGQFDVHDTDAHAWVEAWFPGYSWVAFNPTPSADSATPRTSLAGAAALRARAAAAARDRVSAPAAGSGRRHHGGSGLPVALVALVIMLLGLGGGAVALRRRSRRREAPTSDELLAELEVALRRSSFELTPATTLSDLERRFRRSTDAAGYVRAVARARYGDGAQPPTPEQRRALRAQLAIGRGTFGRVRAIWALPPRI